MKHKRKIKKELIEAKKREALERITNSGKSLKRGDSKIMQRFIEECFTKGNIDTIYMIGGAAEYLKLGKKKKTYRDLDFLVVADRKTAHKINMAFIEFLKMPLLYRKGGFSSNRRINAIAIPADLITVRKIRNDIRRNPEAMLDIYFSLAEQGVPLFNKQTGKRLQKIIKRAVEGYLGMQEYDQRLSKWRKKLREKRKKARRRGR